LSEDRYRAFKASAVQRGKTIGQLIDDSLHFYGIKSQHQALALVRQARERSQLTEQQALELARKEARAARRPGQRVQ